MLRRPCGWSSILRPRPDAVLFDWDDTLAEHRSTSIRIMGELKQDYGAQGEIRPEELLKAWYKNPAQCCQEYFPDHTVEEMKQKYREKLLALPVTDVTLLDGAEGVLRALKAKGIPMAIVSNKSEERLKAEIAHCGLTDTFGAIIGYDGASKAKPHFGPIGRALKALNVGLGNIWMVGDSPEDAGAARSDGITHFHVGDFLRDIVRSHIEEPVIHLESLSAFQEYIESIPDRVASAGTLNP